MTVMEAFGVAFLLWSQAAGAPPSIQERDLFNMNRSEVDIYKCWEYAEATASDPAFITTDTGFVGLAPNSAVLEDGLEVVLLDNCKMPVLPRQRRDSLEFVGFAYIHGIMHDELKSLGQDEGLIERSFTLC